MDIKATPWQEREAADGFSWDQWRDRIEIMYRMLNDDIDAVLDLGAGGMVLKEYLKTPVKYYPVDYIKRNDETIVCDFNKHEFPNIKADVVFVSGCMEYMEDIDWFIQKITESAIKNIVLSYCAADYISDIADRRKRAWANDLTVVDLIRKIHAYGFMLTKYDLHSFAHSPLMKFERNTPKLLREYCFCTGCGACYSICPAGALTMRKDEEGFLKPEIDLSVCINCNRCIKICPSLSPKYENNPTPDCYAVWADDDLRRISSSGGVFTVLAEKVINEGGVVFGAAWTKDYYVEHICVTRNQDLDKLRHSKYLQSNIKDCFREVKKLLSQSIPVLFSGCPCQIAGLKNYLKVPTPLLITVDILCHYVPSPALFRRYVDESFGLDNIQSFTFRDKTRGWTHDLMNIVIKDGTSVFRNEANDYLQQGFHRRLFMNETCEYCFFAQFPRQGDISLGDFHGIYIHDEKLNDGKGTSVVLVNNDHGKEVFGSIHNRLKLCEKTPLSWVMNNRVAPNLKAHHARTRLRNIAKSMPINKALEYSLKGKYDIGIVGPYTVENYGSNLTYYALYRTVRDLGYEPLMVERPNNSIWKPNVLPVGFRENPYRPHDLARVYNTKDEMKELNDSCTMFLVGSDQLFNDYLYHHFGKYITLDWVTNNHKKIAYAASFGADYFWGTEEVRATMSHFLKRFQYFSVRESSGLNLAKDKFGIQATHVLDPVFLCEKKYFDELTEKGIAVGKGKPYISVYLLDKTDEKIGIIDKIRETLALPCETFHDIAHSKNYKTSEQSLYNEDWLRNIAESDFVIADSFHGICFAIIFQKQFVAIANEGRGLTRFHSILDALDLSDRLVFTINDVEEKRGCLRDIDYTKVNEGLANLKRYSIDWLKKALASQHVNSYSTYDLLAAEFQNVNAVTMIHEAKIAHNGEMVNRHEGAFAHYSEVLNRHEEAFAHYSEVLNRHEEFLAHYGNVISRYETLYKVFRVLTYIPRKIIPRKAKVFLKSVFSKMSR